MKLENQVASNLIRQIYLALDLDYEKSLLPKNPKIPGPGKVHKRHPACVLNRGSTSKTFAHNEFVCVKFMTQS